MPIRKLPDDTLPFYAKPPCRHPDHDLPMHILLPPGSYEHSCSGRGNKFTFHVDGTYLSAVAPPSHPTTLGEVWTGVTSPRSWIR
jgi:hypothetical protein